MKYNANDPELLFCSIDIEIVNSLKCYKSIDLLNIEDKISWMNFGRTYEDLVRHCTTMDTEQNCISKHRLVDGDDELYPSCQLNDLNRFICQATPSKYLSMIAIGK